MAGLSWYRAGTVAVTNGGKSVAGVDTLWQGVINPGDALQAPDGKWYEVEVVSSNTALTLKTAYAGATASAQAYAIMRIVPTGNVAADLVAGLTALMQRYNVSMDQLLALLDSSSDVSFSDGVTTLTGLAGLRKLAAAATESAAGRVELATAAETAAGIDGTRAIHPAGLKAFMAGVVERYDTYVVPAGAYVPIYLTDGATSLAAGYAYRISMVTQSTGSKTGAVYLVYQHSGAWVVRNLSNNALVSNHPQLRINGSVLEVFHANASSYSIAVRMRAVLVGNSDSLGVSYFGLDGAMSNSAGRVLVGAAVDDGATQLQVSGVVAADAFRAKSYTKATVPSVSAYVRSTIYVSDAAGGASLAWSDGASWVSFKTNAAI